MKRLFIRGAGLFGALAIVALLVAGCGGSSSEQGYVYRSVDQCVAGKVFTQSYCQSSYSKARQLAVKNAPKYKNASDCRHDWGQNSCSRTTTQPVRFYPTLAAWMLLFHRPKSDPVPLYTDASDPKNVTLANNSGESIDVNAHSDETSVDSSLVDSGSHPVDTSNVSTHTIEEHPVVNNDHPAPVEVHDPVVVDR